LVGADRQENGLEQNYIDSLVALSGDRAGGNPFFPFDALEPPSLFVFLLILLGLSSFSPIIKNKK